MYNQNSPISYGYLVCCEINMVISFIIEYGLEVIYCGQLVLLMKLMSTIHVDNQIHSLSTVVSRLSCIVWWFLVWSFVSLYLAWSLGPHTMHTPCTHSMNTPWAHSMHKPWAHTKSTYHAHTRRTPCTHTVHTHYIPTRYKHTMLYTHHVHTPCTHKVHTPYAHKVHTPCTDNVHTPCTTRNTHCAFIKLSILNPTMAVLQKKLFCTIRVDNRIV